MILLHSTTAIHDINIPVHVETCGGFDFRGDFDWVTLSLNGGSYLFLKISHRPAKFKIIVEDETSISKWVEEISFTDFDAPVWLHPEWSALNDQDPERKIKVLSSISNWVKEHGSPFRAGYQMHKIYDVDRLDPNSRELVPLGGDPNNGY